MREKRKQNVERNVASKPVKKKRVKLPKNVVEKDGVWYVRKSVSFNGKQKQFWRKCEFKTKECVEQVLKGLETELYAKNKGFALPVKNFGEALDRFIETELVEARYDKDGRKISGRRSLQAVQIMAEVLREYFASFDLNFITVGDIEDFKRVRLNTPIQFKYSSRPRALRSVNYELSLLRQIFNFAYRRRWLDRNPFDDAKNIINVSAENRRAVLWTRAEEKQALDLCKGRLLAHLKVAIICLVDGGFRRGELLKAKWTDINWSENFITAKSYKGKSLHLRNISMTDRMREILEWWKQEQKTIDKVTDKSLIIGYSDISKSWTAIRTQIGREDLRIHDLRHVFGSRLVFEGKLPLPLVSVALGHSNVRTTEIYLNATEQNLQEVAQTLNRLNRQE
jgi:integrase